MRACEYDEYRVKNLLDDLKMSACWKGRFPDGRRGTYWFDHRHQVSRRKGWKPWRGMGYNHLVKQILSLERILIRATNGQDA